MQRTLELKELKSGRFDRVCSMTLSVGGKATNAAELRKTINSDNIEDAAQEMLANGASAGGVTQGAKSALFVTRDETVQFSIPKVNIISTLGSSDSVNVGIAFAPQKGSSLKEAFGFGLACSVSNAMNRLPRMVNIDQITALVPQIKIEK